MPKSKRTDSSTTKSKIYLCAFANTDLIISAKRYYQMASALGVFEDIFIYNEWNLHKDFRDKMQDKFHQRGFGYWSWKPQVVLQSFEKMQEGDVLIYADIGCHFHTAQRDRILGYIKALKANGGGQWLGRFLALKSITINLICLNFLMCLKILKSQIPINVQEHFFS